MTVYVHSPPEPFLTYPTIPATGSRCFCFQSLTSLVQNVQPKYKATAVLSNEVCSGGKKSQPACRHGGQGLQSTPRPHPPSFFPLALLPKQNCFQAAPLCSQCCGGGDLTSNSCSLFIFGKVAATSLIGFAIEALSAQLPTQLTLFENIRTDSCDHVKRCSSAFRAGNGVENLFEVTRSTEIEEVFFLATNAVECRLASTKKQK